MNSVKNWLKDKQVSKAVISRIFRINPLNLAFVGSISFMWCFEYLFISYQKVTI